MNWKSAAQSSYPVEVSGWDHSEKFFVENATLEWSPEGTRRVALRNAIHEGAIVFVRLCQSLSPIRNMPIAFQVKTIGSPDEQNRSLTTLIQLHPRGQRKNSAPGPILTRKEIPVC
jgi:hypothetical protein